MAVKEEQHAMEVAPQSMAAPTGLVAGWSSLRRSERVHLGTR